MKNNNKKVKERVERARAHMHSLFDGDKKSPIDIDDLCKRLTEVYAAQNKEKK